MKKGLLVIGDNGANGRVLDYSFHRFSQHLHKAKKKNLSLEAHIISYKNVLADNLPEISNCTLVIFLFFPYKYWNKHIEVYNKDRRIYGDRKFGSDYKKFFERIAKIIKKKYHNKNIEFVNPPQQCVVERDKKTSKRLFQKNHIPTPKRFTVKNYSSVQRILRQGRAIYIKPRHGAMGKGITYLNKDSMVTNFLFRKNRIISRRYDYNWKIYKVKDKNKHRFLKSLLLKDFLWEEAIDSAVFNQRRFDFRVYCVYGKIPYYYARSVQATSHITNWSQGGKIEKKGKFSKYINDAEIKKIKSLALKVAGRLKLNYAGIDIILSKNFKKIYVLEAHSFPGFEKGFNLMKYLAKRILKTES